MLPFFPCPYIKIESRAALRTLLEKKEHLHQKGHTDFTILSPLHAGSSFGLPWWQALLGDYKGPSLLDCGASTGLALHALSTGIPGVICRHIPKTLPAEYQGRIFLIRPQAHCLHDLLR